MNYMYVTVNFHDAGPSYIEANSISELAKRLAVDIKYSNLQYSDFSYPNKTEFDKKGLWSYAKDLLEYNYQDIMNITYEDIFGEPETQDYEHSHGHNEYFTLYFKMLEAGLDKHPKWHKAVAHLGSELQI